MNICQFAAVSAALMLCGCASAPHQITDREDFVAEATREFRGETSERVIKAAEIVLKSSDPADFEFRYNLDGFEGLRRYVIYAVLATAVGREKWDFRTSQSAPDAVRASVSISEAGRTSGSASSTPYEGVMASVPLYRLFWARVEYVLGKRTNWISCEQAMQAEAAKNTNALAALGGLCGPTSDGRDAPAPDVLPSRPLATQLMSSPQGRGTRSSRSTNAPPTVPLPTATRPRIDADDEFKVPAQPVIRSGPQDIQSSTFSN